MKSVAAARCRRRRARRRRLRTPACARRWCRRRRPARRLARAALMASALASGMREALGVHAVRADVLHPHRRKRAVADVQRDRRNRDVPRPGRPVEKLGGEVQAGGGRGDGPARGGVDRLVGRAVRRLHPRAGCRAAAARGPRGRAGRRNRSSAAKLHPASAVALGRDPVPSARHSKWIRVPARAGFEDLIEAVAGKAPPVPNARRHNRAGRPRPGRRSSFRPSRRALTTAVSFTTRTSPGSRPLRARRTGDGTARRVRRVEPQEPRMVVAAIRRGLGDQFGGEVVVVVVQGRTWMPAALSCGPG